MSTIRYRLTPRLLSWSWVSFLLVLLLSPLTASAANVTGLTTITPTNPTLQVGKSAQLIATGTYNDGTQQVIVQAKQVSTGADHTCALSTDGTIKCWGYNAFGQLGDGQTSDSYIPVTVSGISNVVAVGAGYYHTCAVLANGTIQCWGFNSQGQLGNGSFTDSLTPVAVSGINTAVAIIAGQWHTCAVLADSTLRCWGDNSYGQLGNGGPTGYGNYSSTPVTVNGISTAVTVSVGFEHTCAGLADGTIKCWGRNGEGQLGNGTTTDSWSPVIVSGINTAVAVSGRHNTTCALLADGTLRCWGDNVLGQLGNGTTTNSSTPVAVSGIKTAVAISAGQWHACAVLADGTLRCWGDNSSGQLGDGTNGTSSIPATVNRISTAMAVSASYAHTCAALIDGTIECWGRGSFVPGPISFDDATPVDSRVPVAVSRLNTAVAISAGQWHSCAVLADGTLRCWGDNIRGQLGDRTLIVSWTPITVYGISTAVAVSAGNNHTCTVLANGTVKCWGDNTYGQMGYGTISYYPSNVPVTVSGLNTAVAVSAGSEHTCAVLKSRQVSCWGRNHYGQLGGSATTDPSAPVTVSGINTAVAVSAGWNHTCAILANGTIACWGDNSRGQLGNGTTTNSLTPVVVSGISSAVAISAGYDHTCAVLADSTMQCWGANSLGQLGNSIIAYYSMVPVAVNGINTAVAVSARYGYTCAVLADGTLRCWGYNNVGQLGNGSTTSSLTPIAVSVLNTAMTVSAGVDHSCALLGDGTAWCWGRNIFGKLGNAPILTWTSSHPAVATVDGIGRVKALSSGTTQITASLNGLSTSTLITVSPSLTLDGFWPGTASPGQFVFIFGQGFVPQQTKVQINGIPVSFVQVADPTLLFLMLPPGDTRGPITITTPYGSVTSALSFNVPLTGVQITGLWPSIVSPGQLVFVFGSGFVTNATKATVNSLPAPVLQVLDPTLLFFMAPSTPTTGFVTVTTSTGMATSASLLTIK